MIVNISEQIKNHAMTKLAYNRWTDESIIKELRGLYDCGVPMTCRGIGEADRVLFQAALYHFGTLRNVLRAAGLPWVKPDIDDMLK